MTKLELKNNIADILRIDSADVTDEFDFSKHPRFDSMAILEIIAFSSEHFDVQFTTDELKGLTSLESLTNLIGSEHFEN
jgi:acyl carrier protein